MLLGITLNIQMYIIYEMKYVLGHGKNPGNHKILLTCLKRSGFIVVFLKMLLLYAILLSSRNCTQKNFFICRHGGKEIPLGTCKK